MKSIFKIFYNLLAYFLFEAGLFSLQTLIVF